MPRLTVIGSKFWRAATPRNSNQPRDVEATKRLNNPQAAYSIDLVGTDPAALALSPPPAFASQAMAAEITELYWQALMRDVPFRDWESSPLTRAAVSDLVAAGFPRRPKQRCFAAKPSRSAAVLWSVNFFGSTYPTGPERWSSDSAHQAEDRISSPRSPNGSPVSAAPKRARRSNSTQLLGTSPVIASSANTCIAISASSRSWTRR